MKKLVLIVGVLAILLGGLWLLQGLGLVQLQPILCFADCAPLQEPSATWAIIGSLVAAAGALTVYFSLKRMRR
jgi:hypothetical protein